MKVNRLILYSLILLSGCNHKGIQKISRLNDTIEKADTFPEKAKILDQQIINLMEHHNSKAAAILIDSLIKKNPNDGSLYYEKGGICVYDFHLEDALIYFRIAEKLGFSKKLCERQISLWEKVLHAKPNHKIRTDTTVI